MSAQFAFKHISKTLGGSFINCLFSNRAFKLHNQRKHYFYNLTLDFNKIETAAIFLDNILRVRKKIIF